MKKNISKIALKTDKIVSLSKENAKAIIAGALKKPVMQNCLFAGATTNWLSLILKSGGCLKRGIPFYVF